MTRVRRIAGHRVTTVDAIASAQWALQSVIFAITYAVLVLVDRYVDDVSRWITGAIFVIGVYALTWAGGRRELRVTIRSWALVPALAAGFCATGVSVYVDARVLGLSEPAAQTCALIAALAGVDLALRVFGRPVRVSVAREGAALSGEGGL